MDGPLLDNEGYPRNDIDVYTVRHARHKIICRFCAIEKIVHLFVGAESLNCPLSCWSFTLPGSNNDHKALMGRIEEGLFAVHEQARVDYMDQDERSVSSADQNPRQPFAKVQFVAAESPAFSAVRKKKVPNRVFPSVIFYQCYCAGITGRRSLGGLWLVDFRQLSSSNRSRPGCQ